MEVTVRGGEVPAVWLELVRDAIVFALEAQEAPDDVEVGVALVDEAEMAQMNKQFRGVDGPTDVLAFPCEALDEPRPEARAVALGDIALCPDVAREQARTFGVSVEEELELLAVHGLLHLLGYVHADDDEARAMEQRQKEILAAFRRHRGAART